MAKNCIADNGIEVLPVGALKPLKINTGELMRLLSVLVAIIALMGFAAGGRADSSLALQGRSASARLNFVIHIPESLFLKIDGAGHQRTVRSESPVSSNPTAVFRPDSSASVSAVGTLGTGGAMALATHSVTRSTNDRIRTIPVSAIVWTFGGVKASDGVRNAGTSIQSKSGAKTNFYSFQRIHPAISNPDLKAFSYILCAP